MSDPNLNADLDRAVHSVESFTEVTTSTSAVTMSNPNQVQAFKGPRYCRGFHCNAAGDMYVKAPGSSTTIKLTVNSGSYYPYSVSHFISATGEVSAAGNIIAMR